MKKAFTLIEILVVVIIIGILAAIAIPIYTNAVEQKKGEVCINNMRMIIVAEKIYRMKNADFWPEVTHENHDLSQINNNLGINITDNNFSYDVCNYNYSPTPVIKIYGVRQSGQFGNPANPSDPFFGIICEYYIDTNNIVWTGGWFVGITEDPPSFPLPTD